MGGDLHRDSERVAPERGQRAPDKGDQSLSGGRQVSPDAADAGAGRPGRGGVVGVDDGGGAERRGGQGLQRPDAARPADALRDGRGPLPRDPEGPERAGGQRGFDDSDRRRAADGLGRDGGAALSVPQGAAGGPEHPLGEGGQASRYGEPRPAGDGPERGSDGPERGSDAQGRPGSDAQGRPGSDAQGRPGSEPVLGAGYARPLPQVQGDVPREARSGPGRGGALPWREGGDSRVPGMSGGPVYGPDRQA